MPTFAVVDDADMSPSACWCCGAIDAPERMVHLGNHPEVALCLGCARWAAKKAWEIEDLARTGPLVSARDRLRAVRRGVVDRGWHRHPVLRGPLRRIGKRLP
jgi:hypothetical protein